MAITLLLSMDVEGTLGGGGWGRLLFLPTGPFHVVTRKYFSFHIAIMCLYPQ